MAASKRTRSAKAARAAVAVEQQPRSVSRTWMYLGGAFLALFIAFEVYQPAIRSPFLFDDRYLPFFNPGFEDAGLRAWLSGVRPLLMFTYWLNYQAVQTQPYWYHVVNVFFHVADAALVWLIAAKILEWAGIEPGKRRILALFAGLLFLLHPLQTESVTYVASRSENESVFLFNAAFVAFLYRRRASISWGRSLAVLALFGAACLTKEHAAVLPALLVLTDYFWNPGFKLEGVRRNWRLYAPIVVFGAAGLAYVASVLRSATTAGFGMKDLTWYDYFFTQCRAIWVYLRMFVLPYGQNVDHDFAISHSIFDHGAIAGMAALVAASVAAWIWRRKYPVAAYGWFAFLLLLAPTSSFIPIRDVLVERRVYLPCFGLTLICCEFLSRARLSRRALAGSLAGVLALSAIITYQRNLVWGDPVALWKDAAEKSPDKSRPHFQLAYAYYSEGRCAEAVKEYEAAAKLEKPDYGLYVDWALAYDCAHQPDAAIEKLQQAIALERTAHAYSQIGMLYLKRNRRGDALSALNEAEKLDPSFGLTYIYRGDLYLLEKEFDKAASDFRRALELLPASADARNGLDMAQRHVVPTI
jgi:tetratricopeptide (TPR) repeat protein